MESSTEKKLEKLLKLQEIDSKIFEIKKVRGALPEEVQDLEDELIGYNTRLDKFKEDIDIKNKDIDDYKIKISDLYTFFLKTIFSTRIPAIFKLFI